MGEACLDRELTWAPSLISGRCGTSVIQNSLANLHLRHASVNWRSYFEPFQWQRIELPTYAFQRLCFKKRLPWQNGEGHPNIDEEQQEQINPTLHDQSRNLNDVLANSPSAQREAIVLNLVQISVARLLVMSPDDVDADVPLLSMGIDSVTVSLLHRQLEAITDSVPISRISLCQLTVRTLSRKIMSQLQDLQNGANAPNVLMKQADMNGTKSEISSDIDSNEDQSTCDEDHYTPTSTFHRVLCPSLGLCPPQTPSHLFSTALKFFTTTWCSGLMHDFSPRTALLPGHRKAIPFIPPCFNPVDERHEQFVGNTLSRVQQSPRSPPLRIMLSLFRPSDSSELHDPSRPIRRVVSLFALGDDTTGFEGIVHGGLISTLFDESFEIVNELNAALSKNGYRAFSISVTAFLSVKFLAPVRSKEQNNIAIVT